MTAGPPADTTPPDTAITAGPSGPTDDDSPTFEFNASEPGSSFECSIDGGPFTPCASPFTTPSLPAGPHTFAVRARDGAGNVGPTRTISFTVEAKTLDDLPVPTLGEEVNASVARPPRARAHRAATQGWELQALRYTARPLCLGRPLPARGAPPALHRHRALPALRRRRNIVVRAGKSYLARAPG